MSTTTTGPSPSRPASTAPALRGHPALAPSLATLTAAAFALGAANAFRLPPRTMWGDV